MKGRGGRRPGEAVGFAEDLGASTRDVHDAGADDTKRQPRRSSDSTEGVAEIPRPRVDAERSGGDVAETRPVEVDVAGAPLPRARDYNGRHYYPGPTAEGCQWCGLTPNESRDPVFCAVGMREGDELRTRRTTLHELVTRQRWELTPKGQAARTMEEPKE